MLKMTGQIMKRKVGGFFQALFNLHTGVRCCWLLLLFVVVVVVVVVVLELTFTL